MRRLRNFEQPDLPGNWAELLLNLGRRLCKLIRCHVGIEQAAGQLHCTPETCLLALQFTTCGDPVLQLRALVESWPRSRILADLSTRQRSYQCT